MQKFDHNIGFGEKRQFFAENCDHNIGPWFSDFLQNLWRVVMSLLFHLFAGTPFDLFSPPGWKTCR
jgi:hypothetical protein